ncbi:hypothetical protein EVG20_g3355 [Dentipellis fragilis]|uniref:F-box domain-containing protein n=1 Tax=Dentipellis fragilis TaxID=205917 RepID=A0A4Y9Z568_9AGAM|nr:hypothetical protein EVG20_g3355 [Dentipellis fragilis]
MFLIGTDSALSALEYWSEAEKSRFNLQDGPGGIEPRDPSEARKMLDLEMEAVELVMSSLRTRCNALVPVNRLPSEVLVHVFYLLRRIYVPLKKRDPEVAKLSVPSQIIGWVQVTHVCRQWRNVALENPTLWSDIPFILGDRWTTEFFARSQAAPIVIDHNMPRYIPWTGDVENFATSVAQHLWRTQELGLIATPADFARVLPSLVGGPAPLLEKAVIVHSTPVAAPLDGLLVWPPDAFSRLVPRLRHLRLWFWRFSWESITYETLVHLDIKGLDVDPEPTLREGLGLLLAALDKMPHLEVLKIDDVLPPPPPDATPDSVCGPTITCPNLHTFHLSDDIRNCGLALNHIVVPATADHQISCTKSDNGCAFVLPWLHTRAKQLPPLRHLSFSGDSTMLMMTASHTDVVYPRQGKEPFRIKFVSEAGLLLPLMQEICSMVSLSDIETFTSAVDDGLSAEDWSTILGECKRLRSVEVNAFHGGGIYICELLLATTISSEGRGEPLYPFFEELMIVNVHFRLGYEFDRLLELLERRQPLKKLIIEYCSIDAALVDKLRSVVDMVEWDGHEHDQSEYYEEDEDGEEDEQAEAS